MRAFLKKLIYFVLLPLVLLPALICGMKALVLGFVEPPRFGPRVEALLMGDSHMVSAFDDQSLPTAVNTACFSESYYFTYYKLVELLRANPSVSEVYLGLSYHNLSGYYEEFIKGKYAPSVGPKYFYTLPPGQQLQFLSWNSQYLAATSGRVLYEGLKLVWQPDEAEYMGGFKNTFPSAEAREASMRKRIAFQYYTEGELRPYSDLNLQYLHKIDSLCEREGVRFIAVLTPLHSYYRSHLPPSYLAKLEAVVDSMQVALLNLSALELPPGGYIPDGDHVSMKGAQRSTAALKRYMDTSAP